MASRRRDGKVRTYRSRSSIDSMSTVLLTHNECRDLNSATATGTVYVRYNFANSTIITVQDDLKKVAGYGGIKNLACHVQTKDRRLAFSPSTIIDRTTIRADGTPMRKFFKWLFTERMADGSFVDFFLTQPMASDSSPADIVSVLLTLTKKKISIRFVNRFLSSDLPPHNCRIVELYLDPTKMRGRTARTSHASRSSGSTISMTSFSSSDKQSNATAGYERIRVVGKGAFGSAVLYRRKDDESLVIIKEINMHDLSAAERQLALNEVNLLSRLDHPCIVSYFDSFEEDGILMIEMEYADGGTLAQYLSRCESFLPEQEIHELMRQMLSAVAYLHRNSVLHRDLKTANVFLTREGGVKIGDFGISRIMGTETLAKGAETVVGTPYYISPEMCEGKLYNEKSDVWALGCILYEMTCLQKAFEGDNLPTLVNRIMKCEYDPVKGPYTSNLKMLIREMLQLEPTVRPTAAKALEMLDAIRGGSFRRREPATLPTTSSSAVRSALYNFDPSTVSLGGVAGVPAKIRVSQVVIGRTHFVLIVSPDHSVYVWGSNQHGELGLGDRNHRDRPTRMRALDGKVVKKAALGATFSVFLADRGTLLVCGDRKMSGNGKASDDQLEPQLVTSILRMDIIDVAAGDDHVVAVTAEGGVYVWGQGANGRLGTGNVEGIFVATQLRLPPKPISIGVRCGSNATALMMSDGSLMAFGSNRFNKLNLAQRCGFFAKERTATSYEDILTPLPIAPFPERVVDVSLGHNHSGVVLESGMIYLFGLNAHGELGTGGFQQQAVGNHAPVKTLFNKAVVMLACGDGFTLAGTVENELFFWGSKGIAPTKQPLDIEDIDLSTSYGGRGMHRVVNVKTPHIPSSAKGRTMKWALKRRSDAGANDQIEQIVPIPSMVLRLDNSADPEQSIRLTSLACYGKRVFVSIDTTVPMKINAIPRPRRMQRQYSAPNLTEEATTTDATQTWLRREFEEAENIPIPRYLASSSTNLRGIQMNELSLNESKRLMAEIGRLKKQLDEQSSTSEGHSKQMSMLQTKLTELQARQALLRRNEPPPAYVSPTSLTGQSPKKVVYNGFFPDQQNNTATSRACVIL